MSDEREAPTRPKAARRAKPGRRVRVPGGMLANTALGKTGLETAAPAVERMRERSSLERLAFERFVERSLHEAYQDTLRQEVPARFVQLLDRLNAHKGAN